MTNAAAFFDLDRTLIAGASTYPMGVEVWRQDLATNRDMMRWVGGALVFKVFGDKEGSGSEKVLTDFLTGIAGASASSLDLIGSGILPRLTSKVRPESQKLIKMHHQAGRDTFIVSASPDRIVAPLAAALGMTGAIGTKGAIIDGIYTGELDGPFVYGEGKVEAIEKIASDRGYDLRLCYAYSDSVSDLPMLEAVGHPVAVNPDSELDTVAHERGWPIVIFARKTKQAVAWGSAGATVVAGATIGYALGRQHGRSATLAHIAARELGG